jgi:hypothetical protein
MKPSTTYQSVIVRPRSGQDRNTLGPDARRHFPADLVSRLSVDREIEPAAGAYARHLDHRHQDW